MPSLMKGNVWGERKDAKDRKGNPIVTYPVYVEDKHDEIRCHVKVYPADCPWEFRKVEFLSYAGKPLANMQRFEQTFRTLSCGAGYLEFDLGFEVNGNFNDSYRWVRSTKGLPDDLQSSPVKFLLFGLPALNTNMLHQLTERLNVRRYAEDWCSVRFEVPYFSVCSTPQEVEEAYVFAVGRGLEGVMVKQVHALYERKRTDGWLKMKPEETADGEIIALNRAYAGTDQPELGIRAGDPLDRVGSVTVRLEDGSEASPHGIPHDLGKDMLLNPQAYLHEWVEFKFMERDRQGGYRHCVFKRLRERK